MEIGLIIYILGVVVIWLFYIMIGFKLSDTYKLSVDELLLLATYFIPVSFIWPLSFPIILMMILYENMRDK